jgi:hypothetical protein
VNEVEKWTQPQQAKLLTYLKKQEKQKQKRKDEDKGKKKEKKSDEASSKKPMSLEDFLDESDDEDDADGEDFPEGVEDKDTWIMEEEEPLDLMESSSVKNILCTSDAFFFFCPSPLFV